MEGSSESEKRLKSADVVPWRDVRPWGGLWTSGARSAFLWPCSGSDWKFSQIACELRGFPSVKQAGPFCPIYRLNRWTLGPKLSVKQVDHSYSTDQVIHIDKYVQRWPVHLRVNT